MSLGMTVIKTPIKAIKEDYERFSAEYGNWFHPANMKVRGTRFVGKADTIIRGGRKTFSVIIASEKVSADSKVRHYYLYNYSWSSHQVSKVPYAALATKANAEAERNAYIKQTANRYAWGRGVFL